ncbi:MAG: hypothetical protein IJM06_04715 [Firmicutes bacterium]|nr:hypothetical protein [Bacillota bacterium]
MSNTKLIVMLTQNDRTVVNASDIFEKCRGSKAELWGFKEEGIPLAEMKALYARIKECGKTAVMEVVAYSEEEGLAGAKTAAECGCDILMGTMFFDSVNEFCRENDLKYMPYVGRVTQRPSILEGAIDEMIAEAEKCLEKGVYGFDLLGYRYTGDAEKLIEEFVSRVKAPVCVAGSVNSFERLDFLKKAKPWAFTIGGAFFDKKFGEDFCEQVDRVCGYMEK